MSINDKAAVLADRVHGAPMAVPHGRFNADGSGGLGPKYLRTEELLGMTSDTPIERLVVRSAERILGIDTVNAICRKAGTPWPSSYEMIRHLFSELNIGFSVVNPEVFDELGNEPAIFVANHPYGMADAFAVNNMLEDYGRDFHLFANRFLTIADSITHRLLFVDPLMAERNRSINRRAVTQALRHLKAGGDLALFPGRYCSHLKWGSSIVQDTAWSDQISTFVEAGHAMLVPMHISGQNSRRFQYAGLIHPQLRTLQILREFLRGNRHFTVTLGKPVPPDQFLRAAGVARPGNFARALTYSLKQPESSKSLARSPNPKATTPPEPKRSLANRMASALDSSRFLVEQKGYQVFAANAKAAACIMDELASLRYEAFKNELPVDGPAAMVDRYDESCSHLLLWNSREKRLAGSYRYVMPGAAGKDFDSDQLITSMIFRLGDRFQNMLPHSIELGRVAVSPAYQKSYFPLMMLWRGILSLVYGTPGTRLIFGPIAFSPNFSPLSLELIRRWLMVHANDATWAGELTAFSEPEMHIPPEIDIDGLIAGCNNINQLNVLVTANERGGRSLPVLLRHYSGAGIRFPAFGTWPEFDNALTTLAVMDTDNFRPEFLSRYLGKEAAEKALETRRTANPPF